MRVARFSLLAIVVVGLVAPGCNNREFTSQGAHAGASGMGGEAHAGSAGASAGAPGTTGTDAGSGGEGGDAGGFNAGGEAGTAGSRACSCAPGEYCRAGTTACRSCNDFAELRFDKATKLATLSQGAESDVRFPRPGSKVGDLFYSFANGSSAELWYTSNPTTGFGAQVQTGTSSSISAPLFAPGVIDGFNFVYDLAAGAGARRIEVANWHGEKLSGNVEAPVPLKGSNDFSVAIASIPKRAFWMSKRKGSGVPVLITADLTSTAADAGVELNIKLSVGAATCERSAGDATPWVTPDGSLLLFRNPTLDEACKPSDEGAADLYAVSLDVATGLPTGSAKALSSLNVISGAAHETDPALSADGCFIYFASSTGNANGRHAVYRAARN